MWGWEEAGDTVPGLSPGPRPLPSWLDVQLQWLVEGWLVGDLDVQLGWGTISIASSTAKRFCSTWQRRQRAA